MTTSTARGTRRPRGQGGFTLIELMVSTVLVGVLIGFAFQIAIIMLTGYRQHREAVGVQRAARGALDLIADAVRNASAGVPTGNVTDAAGCTPFNAIEVIDGVDAPDELSVMTAAGVVVTSIREPFGPASDRITVLDGSGLRPGDLVLVTDFDTGHVVRVDSVAEGTNSWVIGVEPTPCAGVTFAYGPGALVLRARVSRFYVEDLDGVPTMFLDPDGDGPDAPEPLAEGVEDFQVAIGADVDADGRLLDGADTADEWFGNTAGDAPPPAILTTPWRALRLTVVARSREEDVGEEWSARPAVEDREGGEVDGFRRRIVSTVVEIRNLEGSP